jgi:hypothetical protein
LEQSEQEVFSAIPVAFQVAGLLDRPFKRLRGVAAKGNFASSRRLNKQEASYNCRDITTSCRAHASNE